MINVTRRPNARAYGIFERVLIMRMTTVAWDKVVQKYNTEKLFATTMDADNNKIACMQTIIS